MSLTSSRLIEKRTDPVAVFQFFLDKYRASQDSAPDTHEWRFQILSVILLCVLILGIVTAIPSIMLAVNEGLWSIVVIDFLALWWVGATLFLPKLSFRRRVWSFLILVYVLGIWFLLKVGVTGLIYLMAFPVMTSFFCSLREAIFSLLLSSLTLLLGGYWGSVEIQLLSFHTDTFLRWLIVTLNFSFICAVLTVSCNVLLSRLEISLRQQQMSSQTLVQEQSALKKVNEKLRLIFAAVSHLNEVVMIIRVLPENLGEERLRIVFVNDAFERMTGYTLEDVVGRIPHLMTGKRTQTEQLAEIQSAWSQMRAFHVELICYKRDGSEFWVEVDGIPLTNDADNLIHWVMTARDINEKKEAEEHIHRLAYFDVLTGLPNRRLLLDRIGVLLAHARRTGLISAVLFIDLDKFKYINDARGHAVGDALLKQVAHRLVHSLREVDTVSRIGGDEFVVLLVDISDDLVNGTHAALTVTEKIQQTMMQIFDIDGLLYNSSCSIGVTLLPRENQTADDLLREADTAMYRAKSRGRNQIAFYEKWMQNEIEQRLTMERELGEALDSQQLSLHIQAQVNRLGTPVGGELLMRWTHPVHGPISPAVFIPVAEDSGLILRLGDWLLREACLSLNRLKDIGMPIALSVNVSPKQFRQPDFVEKVKNILRETGADPTRLIFEVTEGLLIDNLQETIGRILEFNTLGIRFSIDDFGTGYSSFSYLKKLPLYELKIDKSFVQDTPDDLHGTAIVRSILSIAAHLGLKVVAEGVETRQQADFLIANGCGSMQGFLFSYPMPLDQWIALQRQIGAASA